MQKTCGFLFNNLITKDTESTTEREGKREVEQPRVGPQGETRGSERVKGTARLRMSFFMGLFR